VTTAGTAHALRLEMPELAPDQTHVLRFERGPLGANMLEVTIDYSRESGDPEREWAWFQQSGMLRDDHQIVDGLDRNSCASEGSVSTSARLKPAASYPRLASTSSRSWASRADVPILGAHRTAP